MEHDALISLSLLMFRNPRVVLQPLLLLCRYKYIPNFARYRSQARCPVREEGGLSVGLATLPRQKAFATETFVNKNCNSNHTDSPRMEIMTGYRQSPNRRAVTMTPPFLKVRKQQQVYTCSCSHSFILSIILCCYTVLSSVTIQL